jgi:hypothetical protein
MNLTEHENIVLKLQLEHVNAEKKLQLEHIDAEKQWSAHLAEKERHWTARLAEKDQLLIEMVHKLEEKEKEWADQLAQKEDENANLKLGKSKKRKSGTQSGKVNTLSELQAFSKHNNVFLTEHRKSCAEKPHHVKHAKEWFGRLKSGDEEAVQKFGAYDRYQVGGDIYQAVKAQVEKAKAEKANAEKVKVEKAKAAQAEMEKVETDAKGAATKLGKTDKQTFIKLSVNQQKYLDILQKNPPGKGKGAVMALRAEFEEDVCDELQSWYNGEYQKQLDAMQT